MHFEICKNNHDFKKIFSIIVEILHEIVHTEINNEFYILDPSLHVFVFDLNNNSFNADKFCALSNFTTNLTELRKGTRFFANIFDVNMYRHTVAYIAGWMFTIAECLRHETT